MTQGNNPNDHSGDTLRHIALMLTLSLALAIIFLAQNADAAAEYPDTFVCDETPVLEFPDTTTMHNEYLFVATCDDIKSVAGDFVTVYLSTRDNQHIKNISKYEVTDAGVQWVSPLTDSNGNVWASVHIDPLYMDCNVTGVPYSLHVHWDGQEIEKDFDVVCPIISFDYYRIEVPNWEKLRVTAAVTDNRGHAMRNMPCIATVASISSDENYVTIKQETIEKITDVAGKVRFEFDTGFMQDLLQGYEYTTYVNCAGGDGNFTFEIIETSSENIRNPLYFTIVFVSNNIVPIILVLILVTIVISVIYFMLKDD